MNLTEKKTNQFTNDFKKLSKENNQFYTYLAGYISAIMFCFILIFTRNLAMPVIFSSVAFLTITYGMRKIYKKHEGIYIQEELTKWKDSL